MHLTEEEQSEEQRKDFDPTPSRSRDVSGGNLTWHDVEVGLNRYLNDFERVCVYVVVYVVVYVILRLSLGESWNTARGKVWKICQFVIERS